MPSFSLSFTRGIGRGPRWIAALALVAGVVGCTPQIGDKCQISTDCSVRGDRLCDTAQPGGYCTQINCSGGGCADEASCVLFNAAMPGCGFDDRSGPRGSRIARSFCMAACESNGDCRPGYVCADPRTAPWNAVILDDVQGKRSCLAAPPEGDDAGVPAEDATVCKAVAPEVPEIEAGAPEILDGGAPPLFPDAGPASDGG